MRTINIIDEQYMTEDMRRAYRTAKELGLFDEPRPTLTDKERAYGQGLAAGTAIVAAERAVIEAAERWQECYCLGRVPFEYEAALDGAVARLRRKRAEQ